MFAEIPGALLNLGDNTIYKTNNKRPVVRQEIYVVASNETKKPLSLTRETERYGASSLFLAGKLEVPALNKYNTHHSLFARRKSCILRVYFFVYGHACINV